MGRLKTGTPPRLDSRTINFKNLEEQFADDDPYFFSFLTKRNTNKQVGSSLIKKAQKLKAESFRYTNTEHWLKE